MQAAKIEPYSYYKENIFGREDFFLYRAVYLFYQGEYDKAKIDFEASMACKQEIKELENGGEMEN